MSAGSCGDEGLKPDEQVEREREKEREGERKRERETESDSEREGRLKKPDENEVRTADVSLRKQAKARVWVQQKWT